MTSEIHVTVSPLDYIPPRNYVRVVFPFSLKPGVEDSLVFNDLHEALHKTFTQEPWVSGKVFRQAASVPGWRPGQLELRYHPYPLDGPRPYQLRYQQLDTDWTYADLRDSGFPSGVFPEEILLEAPGLGDVDVAGADIFLAQANFLSGGLLLAMTTSHVAMDASAMLNITKLWAENFRELHNRDAGGKVAPSRFTAYDRDRSLPDQILEAGRENGMRASSKHSDNSWLKGLVCLDSDYPGEDVTGETQAKEIANGSNDHLPLPPHHPSVMINRIIFLSSRDLAALQKECATEPLPAGASHLSVSDAINALLWRGVMRARASAARARSSSLDEISVLETPVDVRDSFAPDFPPNYLGNCFLLSTARIPLIELIAPATSTPLGRVAQIIRQGATRLDSRAVHDAYALLRSTADFSRVQGRFVERPDSADFLISNIISYPLSDISFGDRYFGNGGMPQVLRVLHAGYAPYVRLAHVLPRSARHGGVELSVNLFDDEMAYFEADAEMNKYLVPVEL